MVKRDFLTPFWRRVLLVLFSIGFVLLFYGSQHGRQHMSNRVIDWLPEGFQETHDFYWFQDHFSETSLLMVSWDGCLPDDQRADKIAQRLTTTHDDGSEPYCQRVTTTGEIYRQLTADPLNLSPEEAFDRMTGWILSQDCQQGCLVLFLSKYGMSHPHESIDEIRSVTAEETGLPSEKIMMAGPTIESVAIDDVSYQSQQHIVPFFLLTCVIILLFLLHSWIAVLAIFAASIFNEELSGALIYYTGHNTDSISLLSASLLFVLTISGSLHLLNYYRDNIERFGKKGAVFAAIKHAFLPCALACLTTVLGLFSLAVSKVRPIRMFGIFSTVGLILGTFFFFLSISSFIEQYPIRKWENSQRSSPTPTLFTWLWKWFPNVIIKYHRFLAFFSLSLLVIYGWSLPKLQTTVTFHGMFPKDAPVIRHYNYLESHIGGLVPLEAAINFPREEGQGSTLSQLQLLDAVEAALWEIDSVQTTVSALNFLPALPDNSGSAAGATFRRTVFNKVVAEHIDALRRANMYDDRDLPVDNERALPPADRWRVSIRVKAQDHIEYGAFLAKIKETVNQAIDENQASFGLKDTSAMITGGVPLAHKAQKQLLDDLSSSYMSAFVMILLTLMILLRGIIPGCVAMIPNIFPSVLIFGAMAALKRPVDMGTMMTASVALGISVDGTIHFLNWYKQGLSTGLSRDDAIRFSYRQCATAMVQSTIICGGGMLIFAFSRFLPISRFAWMMAILLLVALYGDLVLFPSLLAGPIGKCFFRTIKRKHGVDLRSATDPGDKKVDNPSDSPSDNSLSECN